MKKANATLATCFGFFLLCALSMGNRMYPVSYTHLTLPTNSLV